MKFQFKKKADQPKKAGPKSSKAYFAFYIVAIILVLYGAYMLVEVYDYLSSYYTSYGLDMMDYLETVINYFISNSAAYFIYAFICYGIGMMIKTLGEIKLKVSIVPQVEAEEDDWEEESSIEYNSID